jgi:hypothetical protein
MKNYLPLLRAIHSALCMRHVEAFKALGRELTYCADNLTFDGIQKNVAMKETQFERRLGKVLM